MPVDAVLLRCPSCRTLNRVPIEKLTTHPVCGQCKAALTFPAQPLNGSTASYDREVNDWPEFTLVEFWARWCGYCRMVEPVVNDLASWKAGRMQVLKVDVDAEPSLAQRFHVKATPTFIMYRNGQQQARIDGAPKEKLDLVRWVDQFLDQS